MIVPIIFSIVFIFVGILRLLNILSQPSYPYLYFNASPNNSHSNCFIEKILDVCPIFREIYHPPVVWGRSGHLQTFVYGKLGRFRSPFPEGKRVEITMPDGATNTFDIFQPHVKHRTGDYTILVCPGIANSCESQYIRTFVGLCQDHGYRVVVLNHLGALKSVKLTSPRIFTYGTTDEFAAMVEYMRHHFPQSLFLLVGFSMGANIVVKYLGERKTNQDRVVAGVSICQGYDVIQAFPLLLRWENLRRGYLWSMTLNMKLLLRRHISTLFSSEAMRRYSEPVDIDQVFNSTSLADLDEHFTRRMAGFKSLTDFYNSCSCTNVIDNVTVPMLFMNTDDDPIVPDELHRTPKDFVAKQAKSLLVTTKHGGHLGYYEGSWLVPHAITWVDRAVVQYCDAVVATS